MFKQKTIFWFIVAAFLAATFSYTASIFLRPTPSVNFSRNNEEFQNHGVPNFTLPVFDLAQAAPSGTRISLTDVKAKVILINFWASWCAPCIVEFPSLVALAKKYSDGDRLRVVAVAEDTDLKALATLVAGVPKPTSNLIILTDTEGTIAQKFGTDKLPETYIVGSDHKLIRKVISAQDWMSPSFLKLLDSLENGS